MGGTSERHRGAVPQPLSRSWQCSDSQAGSCRLNAVSHVLPREPQGFIASLETLCAFFDFLSVWWQQAYLVLLGWGEVKGKGGLG